MSTFLDVLLSDECCAWNVCIAGPHRRSSDHLCGCSFQQVWVHRVTHRIVRRQRHTMLPLLKWTVGVVFVPTGGSLPFVDLVRRARSEGLDRLMFVADDVRTAALCHCHLVHLKPDPCADFVGVAVDMAAAKGLLRHASGVDVRVLTCAPFAPTRFCSPFVRAFCPNSSDVVAVFGGSFDPLTTAHMAIARSILQHGMADAVCLVPCGPRADKVHCCNASQRWLQCAVAIEEMCGAEERVYALDVETHAVTAYSTYVFASSSCIAMKTVRQRKVIAGVRCGWSLRHQARPCASRGSHGLQAGPWRDWVRLVGLVAQVERCAPSAGVGRVDLG